MRFAPLTQLRRYVVFRRELAEVLARPLRPQDCAKLVRNELARREANFLHLLEHEVYENSRSPYLPLLRHARIELPDVRNAVGRKGLEVTLGELRDAGVYLSFEEYKSRRPIVRGDRSYMTAPADFVIRSREALYDSYTGGSTGPAVRIAQSLRQQADQALYTGLLFDITMPRPAKVALWRSERPNASINALVRFSLIGQPPAGWFTPMSDGGVRPSWQSRVLLTTTLRMMRKRGLSIPDPEHVPLSEAHRIGAWIAAQKRAGFTSMVQCNVSSAVRVCDAARRLGLDIAGVRFFMISEPLTEAKRREIEAAGAVPISVYSAVDAGRLAVPCMKPADADDMHICMDLVAVIARRRLRPGSDETIDSFLI